MEKATPTEIILPQLHRFAPLICETPPDCQQNPQLPNAFWPPASTACHGLKVFHFIYGHMQSPFARLIPSMYSHARLNQILVTIWRLTSTHGTIRRQEVEEKVGKNYWTTDQLDGWEFATIDKEFMRCLWKDFQLSPIHQMTEFRFFSKHDEKEHEKSHR